LQDDINLMPFKRTLLKIQHDSSSAYCACETVKLLGRETADFIPLDFWHLNSPDISPADCQV